MLQPAQARPFRVQWNTARNGTRRVVFHVTARTYDDARRQAVAYVAAQCGRPPSHVYFTSTQSLLVFTEPHVEAKHHHR